MKKTQKIAIIMEMILVAVGVVGVIVGIVGDLAFGYDLKSLVWGSFLLSVTALLVFLFMVGYELILAIWREE